MSKNGNNEISEIESEKYGSSDGIYEVLAEEKDKDDYNGEDRFSNSSTTSTTTSDSDSEDNEDNDLWEKQFAFSKVGLNALYPKTGEKSCSVLSLEKDEDNTKDDNHDCVSPSSTQEDIFQDCVTHPFDDSKANAVLRGDGILESEAVDGEQEQAPPAEEQASEENKSSGEENDMRKIFSKDLPLDPSQSWDFSLQKFNPGFKSKVLWLEGSFYQKLVGSCLHEMHRVPCECKEKKSMAVCRLCHVVFCSNKCFKKAIKVQTGEIDEEENEEPNKEEPNNEESNNEELNNEKPNNEEPKNEEQKLLPEEVKVEVTPESQTSFAQSKPNPTFFYNRYGVRPFENKTSSKLEYQKYQPWNPPENPDKNRRFQNFCTNDQRGYGYQRQPRNYQYSNDHYSYSGAKYFPVPLRSTAYPPKSYNAPSHSKAQQYLGSGNVGISTRMDNRPNSAMTTTANLGGPENPTKSFDDGFSQSPFKDPPGKTLHNPMSSSILSDTEEINCFFCSSKRGSQPISVDPFMDLLHFFDNIDAPHGMLIPVKYIAGKDFYDFSVMPLWNWDAFTNLHPCLQTCSKMHTGIFENGRRCVVMYSPTDSDNLEKEWYRAVIIKNLMSNVEVYLLDLGLPTVVKREEVYEIHRQDLLRQRPLAIRISCLNVKIQMDESAVAEQFNVLVRQGTIKIRITHQDNLEVCRFGCYLHVQHIGKWFDAGVLLKKLQVGDQASSKDIEWEQQQKRITPLQKNSFPENILQPSAGNESQIETKARITHVVSPNEFYVTTEKSNGIKLEIERELLLPYVELKPVRNLKDLSYPLLMWASKEKRARVKILEIADKAINVMVQSVDTGEVLTVPEDELNLLPQTLLPPKRPANCAYKCSLPVNLFSIAKSKTVLFEGVMKALLEMKGNTFPMRVLFLEKSNTHVVDLHLPGSEDSM